MQNFNLPDYLEKGVYEIRNLINNKIYIGSTIMTFQKRWNHHRSLLRKGVHKNSYLQSSWNKHGEDNFKFSILKLVDSCCTLEEEQILIDTLKPDYNINPLASGTPNLSQETIDKRTKTFTKFIGEAMKLFYLFRDNKIQLEEIPEKYLKTVKSRMEATAWNKGLTSDDVDYSYLKVSKTMTDELKTAHQNTSERGRNKHGGVYVYDLEFNFLKYFRSPQDLEEWSYTAENNFPVKSRFKGDVRMGIPIKVLQATSITKSCNTLEPYKGLYFRKEKIIPIILPP